MALVKCSPSCDTLAHQRSACERETPYVADVEATVEKYYWRIQILATGGHIALGGAADLTVFNLGRHRRTVAHADATRGAHAPHTTENPHSENPSGGFALVGPAGIEPTTSTV